METEAGTGDDFLGRAGQRCHPVNETALEALGVEDGENIAEVIVRGRAMVKRPVVLNQTTTLESPNHHVYSPCETRY